MRPVMSTCWASSTGVWTWTDRSSADSRGTPTIKTAAEPHPHDPPQPLTLPDIIPEMKYLPSTM